MTTPTPTPSSTSSTDRIEREVQLPATRARVWRALTDSTEFGKWFGVNNLTPFVAGERSHGDISHKGNTFTFECIVEEITPQERFSFWWRPYAVDPNYDYSGEPRTLVSFTLRDCDGGTLLKVVESGFDGIPAARRSIALEMNTGGWTTQMKRIANYIAEPE